MSHPIPSTVRADDLLRHLQDLRQWKWMAHPESG
jgi:hypothetical protein